MNDQIFITLAAEERGGLFDFGATLPLVAIEFLLLMFVLNLILYNPLVTLMNQRNEYILDNLSKIDKIKSPLLILSGKKDEVVPHNHSLLLLNKGY